MTIRENEIMIFPSQCFFFVKEWYTTKKNGRRGCGCAGGGAGALAGVQCASGGAVRWRCYLFPPSSVAGFLDDTFSIDSANCDAFSVSAAT